MAGPEIIDGWTRELAILNAIAEALNSSADPRQALERTLGLVADLLALESAQDYGWLGMTGRSR